MCIHIYIYVHTHPHSNIIGRLLFSKAFSSSLSGTLATQASLRGVGVGNQEATVAAATITWLLRGMCTNDICSFLNACFSNHFLPLFSDGTGMLGRILFAWLKG